MRNLFSQYGTAGNADMTRRSVCYAPGGGSFLKRVNRWQK